MKIWPKETEYLSEGTLGSKAQGCAYLGHVWPRAYGWGAPRPSVVEGIREESLGYGKAERSVMVWYVVVWFVIVMI